MKIKLIPSGTIDHLLSTTIQYLLKRQQCPLSKITLIKVKIYENRMNICSGYSVDQISLEFQLKSNNNVTVL